MKFEFDINTVSDVARGIHALINEGVKLADESGECFYANDERYIPVTSDEFEDYKWVRDEHYLPHTEGFWYSSSMQNC